MIAHHHRLRGFLQLLELLRLIRYAVGDFLQMAGDVGDLHSERTNAVGQLRDQAITTPNLRPVLFGMFHFWRSR